MAKLCFWLSFLFIVEFTILTAGFTVSSDLVLKTSSRFVYMIVCLSTWVFNGQKLKKFNPELHNTISTLKKYPLRIFFSMWKNNAMLWKPSDSDFRTSSVPTFKVRLPYSRMCSYQGVKNVHFSENLACFVFLKPPFWDSPFCLITNVLLYWNFKLIKIWKLLCQPSKRHVLVYVDVGAKDHNHLKRSAVCIALLLPLISYNIITKDCTNLSGWSLWESIISTFLDGKIARGNRRVHPEPHEWKLATLTRARTLDLEYDFGHRNSVQIQTSGHGS